MNQVKVRTTSFTVTGDNSSTVIILSLAEFPFPERPPGKPTAVAFHEHPFDEDSILLGSKTLTVTFEQAFSGDVSMSFDITYDPS